MGSIDEENGPAARAAESPQAAGGRAAGAPPSNTAPATSISPLVPATNVVAGGVDSLYLSYRGSLRPGVEKVLGQLKQQAQSRDPELRALAQYPVGVHLYEVSDKGSRRFAFVLTNSSYRIELAKSSAESLPLAHVQMSSIALAAYGVGHCVRELTSILTELGPVDGPPTVSRVDLFVDAVTDWNLAHIEDEQWITRAHDVARYGDQGQRSGYAVGRGGDLSLRLYDKTLEIRKRGKAHAARAWEQSGWDGKQTVWRTEAQLRRNVLREFGVQSVPELLQRSGELWHYALGKWCRLSAPSADDQTRSRWPTHPFWIAVTEASNFETVGTVGRRVLRLARAPSDARLVDMFVGAITSYMAKCGETSVAWALRGVVDLCERTLAERGEMSGIEPGQHVARKVAEKTRRFGTGAAYRIPAHIPLELDPEPRQDGLDYDGKKDGE